MPTPGEDHRVVSRDDVAGPSSVTLHGAPVSFGRSGFASGPPARNVESPVQDDTQPVVRTLIGMFETEALARFAVSCLNSLSHLDLLASRLVLPRLSDETEIEALRRRIGGTYWDDVRHALALNHAVLIVSVAEPGTALTQAVLAEDGGSVRVIVLPPETGM